MNFSATKISYRNTNSFSKLVLDYLDASQQLKEFYNYSTDIAGFKKAIEDRKKFPVNRAILVNQLQQQYQNIKISVKLQTNIEALLSEDTFTVCTAHQPNIFTGHLYFVYKILHAIKLSDELSNLIPDKKFVPVYYMGSEDADLDELGEVHINGTDYKWNTKQTGAVGRMLIDKEFIKIIDAIAGQLSVIKFGEDIMQVVRICYKENNTVEEATFHFVHHLFNKYGLVVLMPDDKIFKNEFASVIKKELTEQFSEKAVASTVAKFPEEYKIQAAGREINLFYLKDNSRERIEKNAKGFKVANTNLVFSDQEINDEVILYPERFSPNVILRPVFQETVLPNIAFIGGGGEIAYWLELKEVFAQTNTFFPPLILRNSFTIIDKKTSEKILSLGLKQSDIFKNERDLLEEIVLKESNIKLDIKEEKEAIKIIYNQIKEVAAGVDNTLNGHVHALRTQALNKLEILEKKILKAQKKKFEAEQRQIKKIKSHVNPKNNLQERVDNILVYLANNGESFIDNLYNEQLVFEQHFTILTEQ